MLRTALGLLGPFPILCICVYRALTIALNAKSWQRLLPPAPRPPFPALLRLRWIGESVNAVLPAAQVGGDVVRARLVARRGVSSADAAASMLADLGTGILTQVIFGIAAAVALARLRPPVRPSGAVIVRLVVVAVAFLAFVAALRYGADRAMTRLLASRAGERWAKLAGSLSRLERATKVLLARERDLSAAFTWHLLGWISQVGETWLCLALLRAPVSFRAALAIEGLTAAARGVAFFVPGGLGVQEVTVVSIGRLVGVGMGPAIALGIAKRAREIVVGVPALLAWLLEERRSRRRGVADDR